MLGPNDTSKYPIEEIVKKTPIINSLTETLIVHHKKFTDSPSFPAEIVPGLSKNIYTIIVV